LSRLQRAARLIECAELRKWDRARHCSIALRRLPHINKTFHRQQQIRKSAPIDFGADFL